MSTDERVSELLAEYGSADANAAELLCDRHPADAVAFTVIEPDLSATDLTYGAGTLYAGFNWTDAKGEEPSRVWKSTDGGASWTELPAGDDGPQGEADSVENYCDIQCSYDNVVEADPNHPDTVFVAGEYG